MKLITEGSVPRTSTTAMTSAKRSNDQKGHPRGNSGVPYRALAQMARRPRNAVKCRNEQRATQGHSQEFHTGLQHRWHTSLATMLPSQLTNKQHQLTILLTLQLQILLVENVRGAAWRKLCLGKRASKVVLLWIPKKREPCQVYYW